MSNLLRNRNTIFFPKPEKILWFYREGCHQPLYKELQDENCVSEFHSIPSSDNFEEIKTIVQSLPVSPVKILVFDDLLTDISKNALEIFSNLGHHRNLTNIFISQAIL